MSRSIRMDLKSFVLQALLVLLQMTFVAVLSGTGFRGASAQSVVFSSPSFVGAGSDKGTNQNYDASAGRVSANQRGDIFWINQPYYPNTNAPNLIEVPAGNTAETVLVSGLGSGSNAVTVDPLNNLWIQDGNDAVLFIPFVNGGYASGLNLSTTTPPNCTLPVTSTVACLWPDINAPALGYYDQLSDIQVDSAGDIYGVDYYDGSGQSYGAKNRLVEYNGTTGVPVVLVDNLPWPNGNGRLAVTAGGDIYYVDGTNLYYSAAGSGTASTVSGFGTPTGISIDAGGNLYVTDEGNNRIVFIPNVGGALNFSGDYSIFNAVSNTGVAHLSVGIDGYGNVIFQSPGYGGEFWKLSVGQINFGIDYTNSSQSQTVNLIFGAAATLGHFTVTGGPGMDPFSTSGSTCSTTTPYAAGGTCSVTVEYAPNGAGPQSGTLQAFSSTGTLLGEARLAAFADAPLLNVDPGTVTAIGTSWHAPSSIAVDGAGNTYVADQISGGIYKNGSTTAIATGFSSPSAVVVDGAGNLYVADTGNERIREVPYVSGAYGTAVTLYAGLSGPSGLALDDAGNLYVADSGNSRVLVLASAGNQKAGTLVTTLGSGFSIPVAVAADGLGSVYVADNGLKTVVQVAVSTSKQTTVVSGLGTAAGIAVDASSSLYVVDSSAQTISRVGNNQGAFGTATTLGTIVAKPVAIALDPLGNLYAADTTDATVGKMTRTVGSLNFGSALAGSSSSALTATLTNGGAIYTSVAFNTPYYSASGNTADFTVQSSSSCSAGGSIYYGYGCTVSAVFNPITGDSYTDTLTFLSNVAADTLVLTGTGTAAPPIPIFGSLTVTGFPASISIGASSNVTVSAFDTTGAAMPSFTGTVTLTSSDPAATLPAPYTFQSSDSGVHSFPVTLNTGGTQSITATSGSISASETEIEVGGYIWVVNATGTTTEVNESGSFVANSGVSGGTSTHGGVAFDSSGNVWSVSAGSNSLVFSTKTGATPTTHTGGGLSSPVSIAVDGADSLWVANSGNNSVSEFLNSGTAQSGTSGYGSAALAGPSSILVDGTGGVWVANKTGNSVTHILGAATPVQEAGAGEVVNGSLTWYVNASASSSDGNGSSPSAAFKTLAQAEAVAQPGDTVLVASGTYTNTSGPVLDIKTPGSAAGGYITFEAAPGATPIVQVGADAYEAIAFEPTAAYIILKGFTVLGPDQSLTLTGAQAAESNAAATQNIIYNGSCISVLGNTSLTALGGANPNHIQILNNTAAYCSGGGIGAAAGDYIIISGNTIYDNAWYTVYGASAISLLGSYDSNLADTTTKYKMQITDNVIYGNEEFIPWNEAGKITDGEAIILDSNMNSDYVGAGLNYPPYTGRFLVANNVIYNDGSSAVEVFETAHADIVNNSTFNDNLDQASQAGRGEIELSNISDVNIYNNIFSSSANSNGLNLYTACTPLPCTSDYNIYYGGTNVWNGYGANGAHDRTVNPLYTSTPTPTLTGTNTPVPTDLLGAPTNVNLQLLTGSPAIGTGTSFLAPSTDILGNPRPSANGYTLGAYSQ